MSSNTIFYLLAAATYAGLAGLLWRPLVHHQELRARLSPATRVALLAALILHGLGLAQSIVLPQGLYLGWAVGLSAALWLGMVLFWLESLVLPLASFLLLLLPISALATLASVLFPQGSFVVDAQEDWLRLHLLIALVSYGLIAIAAVHALLVWFFERYLQQPASAQQQQPVLYRALESLPPLLTQERLLFRIIGIGFVVLTLAIISGSIVSMQLTQQWLPLDHKTIFTVLSWLTFGALLIGRRRWGWRGRTAVRATLVGFVFLLLAYSGSHFVLDVLLQRG